MEHRQAIAFTYTWDQMSTKPLQTKLDELRSGAGISEEVWLAGLSIMDNWGDEVDLRFHIYKIQFPISVTFRPTTAVASLGNPQARASAGHDQLVSATQRRHDSRGADERTGARQSRGPLASSPREYKETVCSAQRARELSPKGDLPPPASSPGYPNQGGYLAISSVVRAESAASLSGDEDDIKEKLRRSLKIDPVPPHASGTSVSTASGALTHIPSAASAGPSNDRKTIASGAEGPLVPLGQQTRCAPPASCSPCSSRQSVQASGLASVGRMTPTHWQNQPGDAASSGACLGAPRSTSVPVQQAACLLSPPRGVSHSPRGQYNHVAPGSQATAGMSGLCAAFPSPMRIMAPAQHPGVRVASRSPNYG